MTVTCMDFCPRCGRYLKDNEYQCPECGNMVRPMPQSEVPEEIRILAGADDRPLKERVFGKPFFAGLIAAFVITFAITWYWRFTFLFFCVPLFLPSNRLGLSAGLFVGICLGSLTGYITRAFGITLALIV
ncbi:MAG: zinc-ribbon domain-containing protein [Thermoplasmata archaeon]|nr:zinc-ribbon domain-containing protein [Thermoplasmata archaeon]